MNESSKKESFPSRFMRDLRPEYYSDSEARESYVLDRSTFEYHLDTITQRNETHDFEVFCRKLCERTICPNLRPQTGPEGGGDGKADSETLPVADELSSLFYIGSPNAGRERWAFAFSAKKRWKEKVRGDVEGIVTTNRGYQRIICLTSRFARAKDRAGIEDELSRQFGIPVTVHDRSWIVEQIIDSNRKDLAFNYLHVGHSTTDHGHLGPADYSRSKQLEDVERAIADPSNFAGMERQLVTEALVAVNLSRKLERPRSETEGRLARAIRLAEEHGSFRQKLEAHYEALWTAFWWFDDIPLLNSSYDDFEALAINSDHARNLEFLSNLIQLLFSSVIHGHMTADECQLEVRAEKLANRLKEIADDTERPNNSLEARTSLLLLRLSQAFLAQDHDGIAVLWPQFSDVLEQAKTLGEFSAQRLLGLIDVFGHIAGNDRAYTALVEKASAFVAERTSEGEGALILLKRAEQLGFEDNFEMIRLLGRATHQLTKKEYADHLISASQLLAMAYRSAGLYWAARAICVFAMASIVIESDEESELRIDMIPTLKLFAWLSLQLRHLPDFLNAIQVLNGILLSLPLTEESKEKLQGDIQELDMAQASRLVNSNAVELSRLEGLPDLLEGLGLIHSRTALLYALGHEAVLRKDGSIPEGETSEKVAELYTILASQPVSDDIWGSLVLNDEASQRFGTIVLGIEIEVRSAGTETSILVAEAVLGAIEAHFATVAELEVRPHAERLLIEIVEDAHEAEPQFSFEPENVTATFLWPMGKSPASYDFQSVSQRAFSKVAGLSMAGLCIIKDARTTLVRLYEDEAVMRRVALITVLANSYHRVFGRYVSRLNDWAEVVRTRYPLLPERPSILRQKLERRADEDADGEAATGHRDMRIRSVINTHLWAKAGWQGVAYASTTYRTPPIMALLFTNKDAAEKIFDQWRDRIGSVDRERAIYVAVIQDVDDSHLAYYTVMITSRPPNQDMPGKAIMVASRSMTMTPENDTNLRWFLSEYRRVGAYTLLPATVNESGMPEFLFKHSLLKTDLSVKSAKEVDQTDVEWVTLRLHTRYQNDGCVQ